MSTFFQNFLRQGDQNALHLLQKRPCNGWTSTKPKPMQGKYNKEVSNMYDDYLYIADEAVNGVSEFVSDTEYFEILKDGDTE